MKYVHFSVYRKIVISSLLFFERRDIVCYVLFSSLSPYASSSTFSFCLYTAPCFVEYIKTAQWLLCTNKYLNVSLLKYIHHSDRRRAVHIWISHLDVVFSTCWKCLRLLHAYLVECWSDLLICDWSKLFNPHELEVKVTWYNNCCILSSAYSFEWWAVQNVFIYILLSVHVICLWAFPLNDYCTLEHAFTVWISMCCLTLYITWMSLSQSFIVE